VLFRFIDEFLRELMGFLRKLKSLPAEFVSSQVIGFAVGGSGLGVGVGCQVVDFRGSIVRTLGHGVLLGCSMQTIRARSLEVRLAAWIRHMASIRSTLVKERMRLLEKSLCKFR
jgi:hypothetical protein